MRANPPGADRVPLEGQEPPGRTRAASGQPVTSTLAAGTPVDVIRHLQGTVGNRVVSELLRTQDGPAAQRQEASSALASAPAAGLPDLIVDDSATDLGAGQQRKSQFLDRLESAIGRTVDEVANPAEAVLARPEMASQLAAYRGQDSQALERSIRRELPETAGATSADAYLPMVTDRVRRSIENRDSDQDGGAMPQAATAVVDVVRTGLGMVAGVVGALFKRRSSASSAGPGQISLPGDLGTGAPVDAPLRAALERQYGDDFSAVRVYTGPRANQLAHQHDARALTAGTDVVFGSGEYRPGSPVGDALIAHELAHVTQQRDAAAVGTPLPEAQDESSLERDADLAALSAVASLHRPVSESMDCARPRLRSGLSLLSCKRTPAVTFDQYRDQFNALWSGPAYAGLATTFDPALDSKGPRNTRARAIFTHLYAGAPIKSAYDANTGGFRDHVDTYMGPEGLDLIGSPRLRDLRAVFMSHPRPVPAPDYGAFRTELSAKAAALDAADRRAIETSNEWQRLINEAGGTDDRRADIQSVISPPPPAGPPGPAPPAPAGARGTPAQLAHIIATWAPTVRYDDGARQVPYAVGATVRYREGIQNLEVGAALAGAETNPGVNVYVRGQVLRGAAVVSPPQIEQFPFDQHQVAPFAMPVTASPVVPPAGDALTVRAELLRPDRTTVLSTKDLALTVLPEITYTEAMAVGEATADEAYMHDATPAGLLGKMTAPGGASANVAAAVAAGRLVLHCLTRRHDSSAYVAASAGGPNPAQTGYFVGASYANSTVQVTGAGGLSLSSGEIVINRTTDVVTGAKRTDDEMIMLIVHEAVHHLDYAPDRGTDLGRYKTEFRAYWVDGRYNALATSYDESLSPPGPKSPRARAIFDGLYGSVTYPFVKPAYDNNTAGFREAVDSYLVPDGVNLVTSMRLEDLRATIESWTGSSYGSFKAKVQGFMGIGPAPAGGALTADDKAELTRERAWRDLVERKVTSYSKQAEIKTILGIPQ